MRSNIFMATVTLVLVAVQAAPLLNGINNDIVEHNPESTGHVNDNAEADVEKRDTLVYYITGGAHDNSSETPEVDIEKRRGTRFHIGTTDSGSPSETPEIDVEKRSSFRYKFIKEEQDNLSETLE